MSLIAANFYTQFTYLLTNFVICGNRRFRIITGKDREGLRRRGISFRRRYRGDIGRSLLYRRPPTACIATTPSPSFLPSFLPATYRFQSRHARTHTAGGPALTAFCTNSLRRRRGSKPTTHCKKTHAGLTKTLDVRRKLCSAALRVKREVLPKPRGPTGRR